MGYLGRDLDEVYKNRTVTISDLERELHGRGYQYARLENHYKDGYNLLILGLPGVYEIHKLSGEPYRFHVFNYIYPPDYSGCYKGGAYSIGSVIKDLDYEFSKIPELVDDRIPQIDKAVGWIHGIYFDLEKHDSQQINRDSLSIIIEALYAYRKTLYDKTDSGALEKDGVYRLLKQTKKN